MIRLLTFGILQNDTDTDVMELDFTSHGKPGLPYYPSIRDITNIVVVLHSSSNFDLSLPFSPILLLIEGQ